MSSPVNRTYRPRVQTISGVPIDDHLYRKDVFTAIALEVARCSNLVVHVNVVSGVLTDITAGRMKSPRSLACIPLPNAAWIILQIRPMVALELQIPLARWIYLQGRGNVLGVTIRNDQNYESFRPRCTRQAKPSSDTVCSRPSPLPFPSAIKSGVRPASESLLSTFLPTIQLTDLGTTVRVPRNRARRPKFNSVVTEQSGTDLQLL